MKAYLVWSSLPERRLNDLLWAFHGNGGRFEIYPASEALMSVDGQVMGKRPAVDADGLTHIEVREFVFLDAWEYSEHKPAMECRRCNAKTAQDGRCKKCGLVWGDGWLREQDNVDA